MKLPVFSIHDNLVGYGQPFTDHSDSVADRAFRNSLLNVLDGKQDSYVSPVDLSLYRIGEFDTSTGEIVSCDHRLICRGTSVVNYWEMENRKGDFCSEEV